MYYKEYESLGRTFDFSYLKKMVLTLPAKKERDETFYTLSLIVRVNIVLNRTMVVGSFCHHDDQTQPTFEMTPRFKPFTKLCIYSC